MNKINEVEEAFGESVANNVLEGAAAEEAAIARVMPQVLAPEAREASADAAVVANDEVRAGAVDRANANSEGVAGPRPQGVMMQAPGAGAAQESAGIIISERSSVG